MSQKEFGCFFCAGKSSDENGKCNKCGKDINIGDFLHKIEISGYRSRSVIGRGFNGWMLQVEDQYQVFAMKVVPLHRLKERAMPDKEARALAACAQHRNIARFFRPINTTLTIDSEAVEVFGLVFEFVADAEALSKVVSPKSSVSLERRDVAAILIGIASGLARMHASGFWHDDLHDDNILVRLVRPDENITDRYEPKLVDFGSTKPKETPESNRSDYFYLSKHIFNLALAFEERRVAALTPADRTSRIPSP